MKNATKKAAKPAPKKRLRLRRRSNFERPEKGSTEFEEAPQFGALFYLVSTFLCSSTRNESPIPNKSVFSCILRRNSLALWTPRAPQRTGRLHQW